MKKKTGIHILMIIFAGIFLFSAGKIIWTLAEQYREEEAFEKMAAELSEAAGSSGQDTGGPAGETEDYFPVTENYGTGTDAGEDTGDKAEEYVKAELKERTVMETDYATGILTPYLAFYEKNPDFYGWICIDGTKVNYPVMYTPTDPEYYLRRAFDGSDARSGTPFLDASCTEEGNLYVVYGHRMKNRTMFGTLPYYEKRDYWAEHPYIYFDTLYEQGTYEIVAAFYSKIYEKGEAGFRYYQYKSLTDEQTFADFKKGVEKSALYKTDEELMFGDKVLLLSTCSYHTDEGRFVVVAKKLTEE